MPFRIVRNDITRMQVDAIVNTANPLPCYGPGTDAAVYEAAGSEKLLAERLKIGVIKPGHSVMTEGFDLPAKYIIHTVGTPWQGGGHEEESIIRSCYKSIFGIVSDNNIESLAIPLLASGSYGFPKGIALRIALSEIEQFMAGHDTELYLVVFDEKSFSLSEELYGDIDDYITDNYVEEKLFSPLPPPGASFPASANMAGSAPLQAKARFSPFKFSGREKRIASDRIDAESTVFECAEEPLPAACKASADSRSLDDVINNLDKTFMELVFSFADAKGMTDVEVQKKANLDRKAFSKLKCGTTKNPSKSTALALAIALELNLDDTKDLLSRAGLALSPCSRQDVIVQYFIERGAYDIFAVNIALFEHGEQPLGCAAV